MRLLLDTQVALWWLTASSRLSKGSRETIAGSRCIVSVASIWEVAIKHRLGKLPVPPGRFRDEMRAAGATVLPISEEHAVATADLPGSHNDPFDRLLISVAQIERLVMLTADEALVALGQQEPSLPIKPA